jgi:error-prone DNA polymerase
MNFIHLHTHSSFSRCLGIGAIEELCHAAVNMGMDTFALTDTNGLYGLIFFLETAREMNIKPIVGSEITTDNSRAVILVKSREGYSNLCRVISARQCHKGFELADALREYRKGLIILSDDFKLLKMLRRDSDTDLYVEMSPGYSMHKCLAFAREYSLPPIATNRVYLINKEQYPLHRVLRAIALNTKLSRLKKADCCLEHNFFCSARYMIDHFPHAPDAIANTVRVANECMREWDIFSLIFPSFESMGDKEAFDTLYRATIEGCKKRYGEITERVQARIDHEMRIISEKNFSHYFLVVADLRKKGAPFMRQGERCCIHCLICIRYNPC